MLKNGFFFFYHWFRLVQSKRVHAHLFVCKCVRVHQSMGCRRAHVCVLRSHHPVCEFCNLFTALAVSLYCWWEWKICLTVVAFQWKFTSAPFCAAKKKEKKNRRRNSSHKCWLLPLGVWWWWRRGEGLMCFRFDMWDVEQVIYCSLHTWDIWLEWFQPYAKSCVHFFSLYPSSSLWLSSPCLPNIQASQPACCWEAFLFHLLNFPSSRRFLTGSYTSVPLFLLNSLPWPLCRRHERAALGCQASVCRLVDIAIWCLFLHSSFFPIHDLIAAFIAASVEKGVLS